MPIDDETLELLERRLAEKVEARVRGRLFKLYGGIGSGILAGLGLLGYDLYGDFKEEVNRTAKGYAQDAVRGSVSDAEAAAREARAAAEAAEVQARDAGARLAAMDEWRHLGAAKLQGALETVGALTASVDGSKAELETRLADMRARVEEAEGRIENAKARGESYYLNAQYEQVILDLSAEVERMDRELDALHAMSLAMAGDMPPVAMGAPAPSRAAPEEAPGMSNPVAPPPDDPDAAAPDVADRNEEKPGVLDPDPEPEPEPEPVAMAPLPDPPDVADISGPPRQTAAITDKAQQLAAPSPVTIFVQYDGVPRAMAERLNRALSAEGYAAPGVERLDSAAGKRELRFFYEDDRPAAEFAARAADDALAALGFATGVEARLLDHIRVKPRPGVFELWVEPVPAR
ncbi:MAG: hypothetical protein CML46_02790 [Rhodobacteraceae bacterium]|nr:hypothetical protein [Paracoccaceae bacterium]